MEMPKLFFSVNQCCIFSLKNQTLAFTQMVVFVAMLHSKLKWYVTIVCPLWLCFVVGE